MVTFESVRLDQTPNKTHLLFLHGMASYKPLTSKNELCTILDKAKYGSLRRYILSYPMPKVTELFLRAILHKNTKEKRCSMGDIEKAFLKIVL